MSLKLLAALGMTVVAAELLLRAVATNWSSQARLILGRA
jgi:hypothetical protein